MTGIMILLKYNNNDIFEVCILIKQEIWYSMNAI